MKKIFLSLFIIFISIFFFVFIKGQKEKDTNVLTVWTLQLGSFDKYINRIIDDFEKENPQIKIQWIDVPYSEGEKRTLSAIMSDNPPDLINLTPDFSMLLAQKNALYMFERDKLKDFVPALIDILRYKNQYFGIPFYATSAVTLYNKSLYQGAIPATYDDLFKVKPKSQTYITMFNFCENDTLLKLLDKYDIDSYKLITSQESVYLFNEFLRLYNSNYIPKESVTQSHRDSLEKYMSNKLIFLVTGANFINMIKENAPSVYYNTVVLPQLTGSNGKYDASIMNFVIPKKSKNPQMALKFALFFTNKQNQLEFAKMTTILPANKETLNDEFFKIQNPKDLQSVARVISAKQLNNLQVPNVLIQNKKELNTLSSNSIQQILINKKPVIDTLNEFAKTWEKL